MKNLRFIYFLPVIALLFTSCSGKFDKILKSTDTEMKYQMAMEYYNKKKFSRAATLFDNVLLYYRGTPRDDSVNFYLAKSHFLDRDSYTAAHYFDVFRQSFPRSQFTEEATFLRCICLYDMTYRASLDPKPTVQSVSAMEEFFYLYPNSKWKEELNPLHNELTGRLEEKAFMSAKLYYNIENYKSAITALKTTLKDNPETRYREDILYLIVNSSYQLAKHSIALKQKDRYQTVIDEYYNIVSEYPESKYRKTVDEMHQEALQFLEKK
jgi:outer membrane protein assembly factor BamD